MLFYLVPDWRGRFLSGRWAFLSNHVPDESTDERQHGLTCVKANRASDSKKILPKLGQGGFPLFAETTRSELESARWLAEQFQVIV